MKAKSLVLYDTTMPEIMPLGADPRNAQLAPRKVTENLGRARGINRPLHEFAGQPRRSWPGTALRPRLRPGQAPGPLPGPSQAR